MVEQKRTWRRHSSQLTLSPNPTTLLSGRVTSTSSFTVLSLSFPTCKVGTVTMTFWGSGEDRLLESWFPYVPHGGLGQSEQDRVQTVVVHELSRHSPSEV